jgi:hypothetical protein
MSAADALRVDIEKRVGAASAQQKAQAAEAALDDA